MTGRDKLNINEWAEEDRPREKLMANGAQALSDSELLAILIGSGSQRESAVALMQRVLGDCGNNLNTLGKMSLHDLMRYVGIGEAKAVSILAACELGKRRQQSRPEDRPELDSADAVYRLMLPKMQDLDVEEAWALFLNRRLRLIKAERISHGGLSETAVDVRVIMREALLCNATAVTLVHNHPSGNCRPSGSDDRITESLRGACSTMRIYMVDHVIVTDGAYYSYAESEKI